MVKPYLKVNKMNLNQKYQKELAMVMMMMRRNKTLIMIKVKKIWIKIMMICIVKNILKVLNFFFFFYII